ncbi:MAG: hypothetical protein HRT98_02875 [Mycoplasmatales bacterium]|nr:hypothetical protein [Mycoplasmatales bacterium]
MNKKTKLLIVINFILWILAMITIFLGAIFVFVAGKGYSTRGNVNTKGINADADNLIYIGEKGAAAMGGILIAISVLILAVAIIFFSLKLNKSTKKIITISFGTTLGVSAVMIIMAILDIAHVWSIWPWLINFGCLINFGAVLLAFKKVTATKPSKSEAIKQIEYLNENGFLKKAEYQELKERITRILKTETKEIKLLDSNGQEIILEDKTKEMKETSNDEIEVDDINEKSIEIDDEKIEEKPIKTDIKE